MNFCVDSLVWTKRIHYFTPETKEQSKQWTSSVNKPAPKKVKTVKSAGKVMATVFWDAMARYNSYRLSSVEANDQCAITTQPY